VRRLCDEEGNVSFLGMVGLVEHFEYTCGCGQSYPGDPMIGVRFSDGRSDEFWKEELRTSKTAPPKNAQIGLRGRAL